jgi:hypothetical protein
MKADVVLHQAKTDEYGYESCYAKPCPAKQKDHAPPPTRTDLSQKADKQPWHPYDFMHMC